jgi:hypothetical protein
MVEMCRFGGINGYLPQLCMPFSLHERYSLQVP